MAERPQVFVQNEFKTTEGRLVERDVDGTALEWQLRPLRAEYVCVALDADGVPGCAEVMSIPVALGRMTGPTQIDARAAINRALEDIVRRGEIAQRQALVDAAELDVGLDDDGEERRSIAAALTAYDFLAGAWTRLFTAALDLDRPAERPLPVVA